MIVVAVWTVGRRAYLERTLASFAENVFGPITRTIVFDDSGDPDFARWLETLDVSVASWGKNLGFSGTVATGWEFLESHAVERYVFHLEEDFVFDRPVDLGHLAKVLTGDPDLDQVALLRGAWYPSEVRAGGIIERNPAAYEARSIDGIDYLAHREIFTMNPSLYRRSLCSVGWPRQARSERAFSAERRALGRRFAYLGDGTPWVSHIGHEKTGHGH